MVIVSLFKKKKKDKNHVPLSDKKKKQSSQKKKGGIERGGCRKTDETEDPSKKGKSN